MAKIVLFVYVCVCVWFVFWTTHNAQCNKTCWNGKRHEQTTAFLHILHEEETEEKKKRIQEKKGVNRYSSNNDDTEKSLWDVGNLVHERSKVHHVSNFEQISTDLLRFFLSSSVTAFPTILPLSISFSMFFLSPPLAPVSSCYSWNILFHANVILFFLSSRSIPLASPVNKQTWASKKLCLSRMYALRITMWIEIFRIYKHVSHISKCNFVTSSCNSIFDMYLCIDHTKCIPVEFRWWENVEWIKKNAGIGA